MKNIIFVVSCSNKKRRELIRGFLASKGFRDFAISGAEHPIMLLLDGSKGVGSAISVVKEKNPDARIVVLNGDDGNPRGSNSADAVYRAEGNDTAFFISLEAAIRAEKEKSRGIKPLPPITVPGKP